MTKRMLHRVAGGLAVVLPLAGLAACTGDDGLDAAVADVVAALESHDLAGVSVAGGDADAFAAAVEPLAAYDLEIAAGEVERDGSTATVPLEWTWDVEGRDWVYDLPATLEESDGSWALAWDPELVAPLFEDGDRIEVERTFPDRAELHGADGEVLVTERPVERYGLDKSWIEADQVASSARAIAEALQIDADAFVDRAEAMGDMAFVEAITLRPEDAETRVADDYRDIPGANVIETTMQLAPTRAFAREILGTVGEATAEIVEESDGAIRAGDEVGLFGLQAAHDAELRGMPEVEIWAVACAPDEECENPERRQIARVDAEQGEPLELTLDADLQAKAEEILTDETEDASAIVAIRPSTGAVLAAANGPGNDGLNAATAGQYAPGSTFKVVTALALLRAGVGPEAAVACADEIVVDGYAFHNYPDYPSDATGEITLRDAIAHSCNTALIGARDAIDAAALDEAASSLGFGADLDAGFPAFMGSIPEPESETERAASLIGQGRVLASPLAMATVAASIAAGETVAPRLVAGAEPDAEPAAALGADEADLLRGLMRGVVADGSATFLSGISPEVSAKTGTAEYGEPGDDGELSAHGWMIAFQGDLAVAVLVAGGGSGAESAGPLVERLLG